MVTIIATVSATQIETVSKAVVTLSFTVDETDPYLSQVAATVAWGDGQTQAYPLQTKPLGPVAVEHAYPPGTYLIRITAVNAEVPNQTQAVWMSPLTVVLANQAVVPTAAPVYFGPIFPRINGFPDAQDWQFNVGTDGLCLEASLVSILFTNPGERLMRPNFGCGVRRLVFDPNDPSLLNAVRELVTSAVSANEPRVTLTDVKATQQGTQVNILITFTSNLGPQTYTLLAPLSFSGS
jgi:phage baseplate assembly protein W